MDTSGKRFVIFILILIISATFIFLSSYHHDHYTITKSVSFDPKNYKNFEFGKKSNSNFGQIASGNLNTVDEELGEFEYEEDVKDDLEFKDLESKLERDMDVGIRYSVNSFLTLSIPKSGTTAVDWIVHSIFTNLKKEIDDKYQQKKMKEDQGQTNLRDSSGEIGKVDEGVEDMVLSAETDNQQNFVIEVGVGEKEHMLRIDDKLVTFTSKKKHEGFLHDSLEYHPISSTLNLKVSSLASLIRRKATSANSDKAKEIMGRFLKDVPRSDPDFINYKLDDEEKIKISSVKRLKDEKLFSLSPSRGFDASRKVFQKKHFTIFRDPIAVLVSWYKYVSPTISKDLLSEKVMQDCERKVIETSVKYYLTSTLLPSLGYSFHNLFFEDMRNKPDTFIYDFANNLGLKVNDNIVQKVKEETSPEHMKSVQDELLHDEYEKVDEITTVYAGLTKTGRNSRKVRTAATKGYQKEITADALAECNKHVFNHLPPDLLEKLEFDIDLDSASIVSEKH